MEEKIKPITTQWEFATEEPMLFLNEVDTNLRKLEKKFKKNPFIFEDNENSTLHWTLPTKTKKKIVGSSEMGVVNVVTGEVEGGNFLWTEKTIDEEQFAKIYLKEMHNLYGLKRTGLLALGFVFHKLEKDKDAVYIYYPEMQNYCNYKSIRTCYTGMKELVAHKFIAPSFMAGWWFINPKIIFNGNRLTLMTTYTKQHTNDEELQVLGKGE